MFNVRLKFNCFKMFVSVQCSKTDVQVHSMFDEIVFDPSLLFSWKNATRLALLVYYPEPSTQPENEKSQIYKDFLLIALNKLSPKTNNESTLHMIRNSIR